jgi:hypothetical protein
MSSRVHTIVVLGFLALLQGVAPLLHAHRDGLFVRTGTHTHYAPVDRGASAHGRAVDEEEQLLH